MSSTQEKQLRAKIRENYIEAWGVDITSEVERALVEQELAWTMSLIDSAKREAYKQGYIDAGIKALTEQSEESKLSACCGAEITETGFCTDCKDNC